MPSRVIRILAVGFMSAIVVMGAALAFVLAARPDRSGEAAVWPFVVVLAVGAMVLPLIETVGYRVSPLPVGLSVEESRRRGLAAFQAFMIVRSGLSELVAIAAFAATLADPNSTIAVYLLGGGISLWLMAGHVWPGEKVVAKVQARLDYNGAQSDLARLLADAR